MNATIRNKQFLIVFWNHIIYKQIYARTRNFFIHRSIKFNEIK